MRNLGFLFVAFIATIFVQAVNLNASPVLKHSLSAHYASYLAPMDGGIEVIFTGKHMQGTSAIASSATFTLTAATGETAQQWTLPAGAYQEFDVDVPVGTYDLTVTSDALAEPIEMVIRVK